MFPPFREQPRLNKKTYELRKHKEDKGLHIEKSFSRVTVEYQSRHSKQAQKFGEWWSSTVSKIPGKKKRCN